MPLTFRQKIDEIRKTNPYGLDSIHALEKFCGISNSSLGRAFTLNKEPSVTNMKKLISALRIPRAWWDNPIGEPFINYDELLRRLAFRVNEQDRIITELRAQMKQLYQEVQQSKVEKTH